MTAEESIFNEYRGKRVLLDTNLLLLYLIGMFERGRVARFKRTSDYTEDDFDLLANFLASFRTLVTTPHLLTEVSNLADSLPGHLRTAWAEHFALQTSTLLELFQPATKVMKQTSFTAFGLADAAIHGLGADTLILTEDFALSGFLRSQEIAVLNFKELVLLARWKG